MRPLPFLLLCALLLPVSSPAEEGVTLPGEASKKTRKNNPAFVQTEDDPALPPVLLIGDSISIGYTPATRDALKGKANLHRIPGNAGHTEMGLNGLPKWLNEKNGSWDLIHFNFGLWDLCYRNPESKTQGNRDKVDGTLTHTPEEYAANLEKIVQELKKTGAILVFATTTPVPEGEAGRKLGDDDVYNQAALEVMQRHDIAVNDLHAIMADKMPKYAKAPGDVHFTPEGYAPLAEAVAETIERLLKQNQQ
jgi:lysophospholipase L1-like esterase